MNSESSKQWVGGEAKGEEISQSVCFVVLSGCRKGMESTARQVRGTFEAKRFRWSTFLQGSRL